MALGWQKGGEFDFRQADWRLGFHTQTISLALLCIYCAYVSPGYTIAPPWKEGDPSPMKLLPRTQGPHRA